MCVCIYYVFVYVYNYIYICIYIFDKWHAYQCFGMFWGVTLYLWKWHEVAIFGNVEHSGKWWSSMRKQWISMDFRGEHHHQSKQQSANMQATSSQFCRGTVITPLPSPAAASGTWGLSLQTSMGWGWHTKEIKTWGFNLFLQIEGDPPIMLGRMKIMKGLFTNNHRWSGFFLGGIIFERP
jgi:hypothetical protein